jgi:isopentenyl diphosphate isomerase/L-lactate dehydrogenase-like FMN-dependent dehydrogenase
MGRESSLTNRLNSLSQALALGARAVFLGRPVLWGLAHSVRGCVSLIDENAVGNDIVAFAGGVQQGEAGVSSVLRILNEELKHAMLFAGTASLKDIGYAPLPRLLSPPRILNSQTVWCQCSPQYVRRGPPPLPSNL